MTKFSLDRKDGTLLCAKIRGITLHSRQNPEREAKRLVQRLVPPKASGVLVFGFGLGYHIRALQEVYPNTKIICLEPDLDWINYLSHQGIKVSDCIVPNSQIPIFAIEQSTELIRQYCKLGFIIFALESYKKAYPEMYSKLEKLYEPYSSRQEVNRNTLQRFGHRWVINMLSNFLLLKEQTGIRMFRDSFCTIPALLIAGGPSVTNILPILGELQQRMLILAVDTSYSACRRVGVEPDFLVSCDPQYWNTKHLERCENEPTTIDGRASGVARKERRRARLISESSAHPRLFRLFPHRRYFCKSYFPLGNYFEDAIYDLATRESIPNQKLCREALGTGGSVACTAWDFLRYIGVSQIYIAGMDMGFPGHETHFRGSYFETGFVLSGMRLRSAETLALNYLYSGGSVLRESYSGSLVLSDRRMDVFCQWFEIHTQNANVPSFVLSSESRKIDGMQYCSPQSLIDLPILGNKIKEKLDAIDNSIEPKQCINPAQLLSAYKNLRSSLSEISQLCMQALEEIRSYLATQLRTDESNTVELGQHSTELRRNLIQVLDSIDKKILSSKNRNIIGFFLADSIEEFEYIASENSFASAIQRSRELYTKLHRSSCEHIEIFNNFENKIPLVLR